MSFDEKFDGDGEFEIRIIFSQDKRPYRFTSE